jgi:hypothetical protein
MGTTLFAAGVDVIAVIVGAGVGGKIGFWKPICAFVMSGKASNATPLIADRNTLISIFMGSPPRRSPPSTMIS